ncbi:aminodeoxychorismate/anthranilate synthase component II [Bacillus sp. 31A1R]|uniref:Aminodeoxychorismate/anthranilate synthase component II n=1 Tax=Robertmurraya mangrovi TaxID=3098077 RepID=A0ABU5J325_9BACI|nr:aminodeoxychorismate/anthranilate synthase component II [Bacillus sp. 31A1R]MDZ5473752.1 aminodeoxychorismate/anthranilate synthase component II [Bacillus sp. 31A1R]
MILLIDNYDSFTYNLYQYLGQLGKEVMVKRNDEITLSEIENLKPEAIVLSPGPGRPENAGICIEVIRTFYRTIPILGICLGHQAIGYCLGGKIEKAEKIMHGKVSKLTHSGSNLFQYLSQPLDVMRYHSLVIKKGTLPGAIKVTAKSMDDQEIMAIKHEKYPLYGLQFHPESVGTTTGLQILKNFLQEIRKENLDESVSTAIM